MDFLVVYKCGNVHYLRLGRPRDRWGSWTCTQCSGASWGAVWTASSLEVETSQGPTAGSS